MSENVAHRDKKRMAPSDPPKHLSDKKRKAKIPDHWVINFFVVRDRNPRQYGVRIHSARYSLPGEFSFGYVFDKASGLYKPNTQILEHENNCNLQSLLDLFAEEWPWTKEWPIRFPHGKLVDVLHDRQELAPNGR